MGDIACSNGISNGNGMNGKGHSSPNGYRKSCWYEEEIEENLRFCFALNSPKAIFIMGGGEGSTAREILRHNSVDKVVMCDIDEEVVDFCKAYLAVNRKAFCDPRLEIIINDARSELESRKECYDVIIGDLADPIEGGPCYKLYTKSFYEFSVKPKLNQGGIFVTQAGPAGIFSHTEVFSCIYNTLRQVFKYVVPYSAHVPSYADTWGWIMGTISSMYNFHFSFTLALRPRGPLSTHPNEQLKDLDDTLYSSKLGIAEALRKNIDDFLVEKCGFPENKASRLRVELFKTYGSSLAGLRALGYDIDADDYHSFVHGRLPYDLIKPDSQLRNLLRSITQRKI
ncbi:hypothetical protein GH714_019735 [Hevea brasiliensis]|uniref:PABS domain-containing protein n=1 Tax=Hevea brasiliensis TaxID=3981 RepID=A0A6A6K5U5_HEVBR|nr:hypothetical protein GH714_019735 [Hevea brasiliensis]